MRSYLLKAQVASCQFSRTSKVWRLAPGSDRRRCRGLTRTPHCAAPTSEPAPPSSSGKSGQRPLVIATRPSKLAKEQTRQVRRRSSPAASLSRHAATRHAARRPLPSRLPPRLRNAVASSPPALDCRPLLTHTHACTHTHTHTHTRTRTHIHTLPLSPLQVQQLLLAAAQLKDEQLQLSTLELASVGACVRAW